MSLSWPRQLRASLFPNRLVITGVPPRTATQEVVALAPAPTPWQAAVDALPDALARHAPRRAELTCVLSNHFVRYVLLPWNAQLQTEAAWLALARHRLAGIYGQQADAWTLRVTATAPRGPRIACAIETALLAALQAKTAGGHARLASVQPHLMAAFNAVRRRLPGASCWLVVEEAGCLLLALIEGGIWRSVRRRRAPASDPAALDALLESEGALLGLPPSNARAVVRVPPAPAAAPG